MKTTTSSETCTTWRFLNVDATWSRCAELKSGHVVRASEFSRFGCQTAASFAVHGTPRWMLT